MRYPKTSCSCVPSRCLRARITMHPSSSRFFRLSVESRNEAGISCLTCSIANGDCRVLHSTVLASTSSLLPKNVRPSIIRPRINTTSRCHIEVISTRRSSATVFLNPLSRYSSRSFCHFLLTPIWIIKPLIFLAPERKYGLEVGRWSRDSRSRRQAGLTLDEFDAL